MDLGDIHSSKSYHKYQVYRGLSPNSSNRLEVREFSMIINTITSSIPIIHIISISSNADATIIIIIIAIIITTAIIIMLV